MLEEAAKQVPSNSNGNLNYYSILILNFFNFK